MSRRSSLAICIAIAMGIPAAAIAQSPAPPGEAVWHGFRGGPARDGVGTDGPQGQPVLRWRYQAQGAANTNIAVGDGLAFTSTDDGILHALDLVTGAERWSITAEHAPFTGPTFADDTLFVFDGIGVAHAYDPTTGLERWRSDAPVGIPGYSGEVSDGMLFVGSDTALTAIDASTGAVRWTYTPAEGGGVHAPAVADGLVYASTDLGGYVALDEATGTLAWRHDTGDDIVATAVVADGVAFAGATDDPPGHLTAFDAKTGAVLWSDDEQLQAPAVADGVAVSAGPIGMVVAHDPRTGAELWRTPISDKTRTAVIADGVAYISADTQHRVYALDAASGTELWHFDVDGGLDCCVSVADGAVFAGTGLGGIYAIGGTDNPAVVTGAAPGSSPASVGTAVTPVPGSPPPATPPFAGTWHTDPLTEDQVASAFVAAGGSDTDGRAFFQQLGGGSTRTAVVELILDSGSFTEHEIGDSGVPVIGLRASYDASPDGLITMRAGSCKQPFSWTVTGDTLVMKSTAPCEGDGVYNTTLFASFPFHSGPAPRPGSSSAPVAGIPDGKYTTGPITPEQIRTAITAAGYDASQFATTTDSVFTLQFDSGHLRIYMSDVGGPASVGWSGSFSMVDADTFEAHDSGSDITYDYTLAGDVLTVHMVNDSLQDPGELAAQAGIFDSAPFTRMP